MGRSWDRATPVAASIVFGLLGGGQVDAFDQFLFAKWLAEQRHVQRTVGGRIGIGITGDDHCGPRRAQAAREVVKKGSMTLPMMSAGMPLPVSSTVTTT